MVISFSKSWVPEAQRPKLETRRDQSQLTGDREARNPVEKEAPKPRNWFEVAEGRELRCSKEEIWEARRQEFEVPGGRSVWRCPEAEVR